jgi:type IV pilus assembly protein PilW
MDPGEQSIKGLTLIELLVVMAISGVFMAGVYAAYLSQARAYNTQELTVEMQENLRTALELLQMDLRLAGSNPSMEAETGFILATPTSVRFRMDVTGGADDGVDNNGNYLVDEGKNHIDDDGDGFIDEFDEQEWYDGDTMDAGEDITWNLNGTTLTRTTIRWDKVDNEWKTNQINVALNIDQMNLVYLDEDRNILDDGTGTVDTNLKNIKTIQITLVARVRDSILSFRPINKNIYTNQQGVVILDKFNEPDQIRRRVVSAEIYCRNI